MLLRNLFRTNVFQLLPCLIRQWALRIDLQKLLKRSLRLVTVFEVATVNFSLRQQRAEPVAASRILLPQKFILPDRGAQ